MLNRSRGWTPPKGVPDALFPGLLSGLPIGNIGCAAQFAVNQTAPDDTCRMRRVQPGMSTEAQVTFESEAAITADYATENPIVGWLAGGLNHHIVPHLCPHVCHTHYAQLTRIVRETAAEFGIPYRQHPTMAGAVRHHLILLRRLGNED